MNCGIFGVVVVCAGIRRLGCVLSDYKVVATAPKRDHSKSRFLMLCESAYGTAL